MMSDRDSDSDGEGLFEPTETDIGGNGRGRFIQFPQALDKFIESKKEELSAVSVKGGKLNQRDWPDFILRPPNPTLHDPIDDQAVKDVFSLTSVVFWVPELFWRRHVPYLPCPQCGPVGADVKANGWNGKKARPVVGMFQSYFLVCKKYKCKRCTRQFVGYDDGVLRHLPQFISSQFPCQLTRKAAIDLQLMNYIEMSATTGQSFDEMSAIVAELHKLHFYKDMLVYYGFVTERKRGQQALADVFRRQQCSAPPSTPNFGSISDSSRYYCSKIINWKVLF